LASKGKEQSAVRSSLNEIAGTFLEDLGLSIGEEAKNMDGEDMEDYLPVRRQDTGIIRKAEQSPLPFSPRYTGAEARIIRRGREQALIQDVLTGLVDRSLEKSGQTGRKALSRFYEDTEIIFAVKNAAQTKEHTDAVEALTHRIIHDRAQTIAHLLNMQDKISAQLIEESSERLKHAAEESSFIDSLFRR
jgi:hypothetical protein